MHSVREEMRVIKPFFFNQISFHATPSRKFLPTMHLFYTLIISNEQLCQSLKHGTHVYLRPIGISKTNTYTLCRPDNGSTCAGLTHNGINLASH